MKKVAAFLKGRVALAVGVLVVAGGVYAGVSVFQAQNGTEQVLVLEPKTLVQQVSVSGKVVAVDEVELGFVQGGRVARVSVEVGDRVKRGAILAELDNADARAVLLQRQAALKTQEANLQSLLDGTRPEEIAVAEASVTSAEVALAQTRLALVDALLDAYRASDDAVKVKVDQFISNPRTEPQLKFSTSNLQIRATVENERRSMEAMLLEWDALTATLATNESISQSLASTKIFLTTTASFLFSASSAVSQGIPTGTITTTTLEGYATDVASARSGVNAAITAVTTAETAYKNAQTALASAQKNLALKQSGATASALAAQRAQVDAARAQVLDAEAQLQKTSIVAPFAGIITRVDTKAGASAAAAQPLITLIADDVLEVESFVPEVNVSLVSVGYPAQITLDAYGPSVVFPASVASVDPAETIRDGVSTYRALLEFSENDERVKAGMTANIIITALTKENALLVPVGVVITKNGQSTVRVKENDAYVERPVTTGLRSSFGEVEILAGLSAGEVVLIQE